MEILILLLVGISLVFIYKIWQAQKRLPPQAIVSAKRNYPPDELRLENVQAGGLIHLSAVGPDLEDFDLKILAKHIYRESDYTWYELEGDRGEQKVWLEYEEDDELNISMKVKDLKLRDLAIERSELDQMISQEDGEIRYQNEIYYFEDHGQAVFYRYGLDDNAESFTYIDFETEDGQKFLSIADWDGELEISLSVAIRPSQISVYSLHK